MALGEGIMSESVSE